MNDEDLTREDYLRMVELYSALAESKPIEYNYAIIGEAYYDMFWIDLSNGRRLSRYRIKDFTINNGDGI